MNSFFAQKKSHHKHRTANYLVRPATLLVSLLLVLVTLLWAKSSVFDTVKYDFLMPLTTKAMSLKIEEPLPADTNRIYLDIEKDDYTQHDFETIAYNGEKVYFNETPYGATALLNKDDFDAQVDLTLNTFAKGDVHIQMTYVNSSGREIASNTHLEHFAQAPTLDFVLYALIFASLLLFLLSLHPRNLIRVVKRVLKHSLTAEHKGG